MVGFSACLLHAVCDKCLLFHLAQGNVICYCVTKANSEKW